MKKWNKKHWLCVIAICLIAISVWIVQGNLNLEITEYYVTSPEIPGSFDCFEIAQISDLHNAEFGQRNSDLLELLFLWPNSALCRSEICAISKQSKDPGISGEVT